MALIFKPWFRWRTFRSEVLKEETLREVARVHAGRELARIKYKMSYRSLQYDGEIRDVDLILERKIFMPVWSRLKRASEEDQKEWQRFWKAVREHEMGHWDICAAYAKQTYRDLKRLRYWEDLEPVFRQAVWALDAAQAHYDEVTDHGRRQETKYGSTCFRV